jgi:hypothetical protein
MRIHVFLDIREETETPEAHHFQLEERRARGNTTRAFKIMAGLDDIDKEKFFDHQPDSRTRDHSLKLRK